jgi:hypothetical protein
MTDNRRLGFDELIAILVAFGTIGGILVLSLTRQDRGFQLIQGLTPSPLPTAQPSLLPSPQETSPPMKPPLSVLPLPAPTPSEIPQQERNEPELSIAGRTPVAHPPQSQLFSDVPEDFWARPFIEGLAARGALMEKDTDKNFRPNAPVTRAEFAAWLQQAFAPTSGQNTEQFKDLAPNFWANAEIDSVTNTGFLKGYPRAIFKPEQAIPRVQVLVALVSGLKLSPPPSPARVLQTYQDGAEIPNYATDKIAAATQAGLVVNYPQSQLLKPNQNATRAEVATTIYQALVKTGKAAPISSPYIVNWTVRSSP